MQRGPQEVWRELEEILPSETGCKMLSLKDSKGKMIEANNAASHINNYFGSIGPNVSTSKTSELKETTGDY